MKKQKEHSWFRGLKRIFHIEPRNQEQLVKLLRDAQKNALIDADTLAMMEGVVLLAQLKVRDIMLPKKQMVCIPEESTLTEAIDIVAKSGHSRFPVTRDSKDEVIGILHAKDLLRLQLQTQEDCDLQELVRQATFVPESKRLDSLLPEFRNNRNHMAIVVDEYGSVSGFVTIEDIVEQIIGDIADEFDIDEEAYIKAHGNQHYIIKALTPIEEFNEQLHADFSDESFDTIGGIVMANFGYLPKRGESIEIGQFSFKIINSDARRIKLLECFDKRNPDELIGTKKDEQ